MIGVFFYFDIYFGSLEGWVYELFFRLLWPEQNADGTELILLYASVN